MDTQTLQLTGKAKMYIKICKMFFVDTRWSFGCYTQLIIDINSHHFQGNIHARNERHEKKKEKSFHQLFKKEKQRVLLRTFISSKMGMVVPIENALTKDAT